MVTQRYAADKTRSHDKVYQHFHQGPVDDPVAGDQVVQQVNTSHPRIVLLDAGWLRNLNGLLLDPVESAASRNRFHPVLV